MQPRIFVPFDFSPAAESALRWAADLRRSLGGGTIRVVHVISVMPIAGTVEMPPLPTPSEEETRQLERSLREITDRLAPGSSADVVLGLTVAPTLLTEAEQCAAELIVMGTHGRSGLKRLILGSVADHIVRHASCPVVTVRAAG